MFVGFFLYMIIFLSIDVLLMYVLLTASLQGVHEPGHELKLPPQGRCCWEGATGHDRILSVIPSCFPGLGGGKLAAS